MRELEVAGLVRRQTNGDDMRSPIFSLTAEGREEYLRLRIPISQFVSNLVEGVDEEPEESPEEELDEELDESLDELELDDPDP